jgi:K+-sensing histidine kinase KdpD
MVTTPARDGQPQTMHLPVRHGPQLLGILVLAAHPSRPFGDYDVRAAELFAEQAACAISQTHRAESARWEKAEREKEDERRGKTADQVAADIRNPMASLAAATKMLQRAKLADSERLELAAVIERQTLRLGRSVEDLLTTID